jgi:hypothetical protein
LNLNFLEFSVLSCDAAHPVGDGNGDCDGYSYKYHRSDDWAHGFPIPYLSRFNPLLSGLNVPARKRLLVIPDSKPVSEISNMRARQEPFVSNYARA